MQYHNYHDYIHIHMQNICLEEMQDDFSSRIDWHPVLKSSVNATGSGKLVGGFNPFENISKIGSSSPGRGENKKYLKPPTRKHMT